MTRVYLSEQGSTGHKRGGRLEIEKDGLLLRRVPLAQVEQVVVVGKGIQLTTALMVDLVQRGVEIALVSRAGRYYGKIVGAPNGSTAVRMAQYLYLSDRPATIRFVRTMVEQKIAFQHRHLLAFPSLATAALRIAGLGPGLAAAGSIDQIRGFEGAAAAAYWQALVTVVPASWGFRGRRHYPAPDPTNALLSFGYTLLLQELVAAINLAGLDPFLGALHTPDPSRPSLALDLEEPLRPLGIDTWVLDTILRGVIRPSQFVRDGERILLDPEGRRQFLALYERQMERRVRHPLAPGRIRVRQAIELHVRLAVQVFSGLRASLEPVEWQ
ncbi:MAG: CRISPR-associated endonuclease Cas1 [Dehalococcoidia bacterium]